MFGDSTIIWHSGGVRIAGCKRNCGEPVARRSNGVSVNRNDRTAKLEDRMATLGRAIFRAK